MAGASVQEFANKGLAITREQTQQAKKRRNVIRAIHDLERAKALVKETEDKLKRAEGARVVDDEAVKRAKDDVMFVHKLLQGQEIGPRLAKREERGDEFDQALKDDIQKGVTTYSLYWLLLTISTATFCNWAQRLDDLPSRVSSNWFQIQTYCQNRPSRPEMYWITQWYCMPPSTQHNWLAASPDLHWSTRDHEANCWRYFLLSKIIK